MTNRRQLIQASAALAATAVTSFPAIVRAQARESLTIMTPFGFIPDFIELMNGVSGGHFAAQGLDAKLLGGQGTAQPIQQLITRQVDFIRASGIDIMRAIATTKVPLVSIATMYQGSTFHMISLKSKPIEKAEDLKGKTVGIVSVSGTTDVFLDLILAKAGLKKDDVKREVSGNSPGALQLIKQGRIDCFIASIQVVVALERMKEDVLAWSTDRYAPMPGQCYISTRQIVEARPDVLKRAMTAMRASVDEIMTQPLRPIFERAAKDFEIPGIRDVEALVAVEKVTADRLWLSEGRENLLRNVPKLWKSGVDALRANNIGDPGEPETLYTNQFVS
ncbi:ABC transporter substrate-binding protein [Methylocella sp. CPCC 101449]|uniref:ABC transporter substrate-binding protein n=1 Tax=Methylocella sp. CPCC 101449 TaxID=2987531 RepID=UPI0028922833|nr:ABC transporter substrate-binding protein [Methylocella sp. CPCC 101449]MDT2021330.1 ABC transporter substrate-binding protein [Methylocella sp. CPCC 101449]